MSDIDKLENHIAIVDTIGYVAFDKIRSLDIPEVLKFLKVCNSYSKMCRIENNKNDQPNKAIRNEPYIKRFR